MCGKFPLSGIVNLCHLFFLISLDKFTDSIGLFQRTRVLVMLIFSYTVFLFSCYFIFAVVVQSLKLCQALCNPVDCSTPGFPVLHQLLELAQTHVH